MNIEEARKIVSEEDKIVSWHGIKTPKYRLAKTFIEGYESGRREALESGSGKELMKIFMDSAIGHSHCWEDCPCGDLQYKEIGIKFKS